MHASGLTRILASWANRYTVLADAQTGRGIDKWSQARHAADPKPVFVFNVAWKFTMAAAADLRPDRATPIWLRFYVGSWLAFPVR